MRATINFGEFAIKLALRVPAHRLYRMSPAEDKKKIYLDQEFIEKAQSPFGAGVLFAKKKDGSFRLVWIIELLIV